MASYGINVRATSTYVTDGAGETYSLGEIYPTTRGGITFGFDTNRTGAARDRNSSNDRRLAGLVYVTNASTLGSFTIDLPNTGDWVIRAAFGDGTNSQQNYVRFKDDTTTFATITASATGPNEFTDASGVVRTQAAWPGSNASISHTFTSTKLFLELGDPALVAGENTTLAHIYIEEAGDSTAPVLTSPVGTKTGSTTATVGATTDEGNGTMYAVVTTSATQPSVAQIKAGQDHTGATAAWSGNQAISSTGAKTFSATGLVAATAYYAHVVHTDAAANDSNRVSSAQFTTDAPTAITSAPLENNTGSVLASTLVDIVVAIKLSDRSTVVWLAQTTDGAGQLVLPSGSLVAAADYLLVTSNTAGTDAGVRKYTAA